MLTACSNGQGFTLVLLLHFCSKLRFLPRKKTNFIKKANDLPTLTKISKINRLNSKMFNYLKYIFPEMTKLISYINHILYITFDEIKIIHIIPKENLNVLLSKIQKWTLNP